MAFRNTILVERNQWTSFKIIDFDKAFLVGKEVLHEKAYEYTEELLDFWLKFNFDAKMSKEPLG